MTQEDIIRMAREASMNKTLEAWLRGYILFDVNGKRFLRYNTALAQRKATDGDVEFNGLHIFKGWRCFFVRFDTPQGVV